MPAKSRVLEEAFLDEPYLAELEHAANGMGLIPSSFPNPESVPEEVKRAVALWLHISPRAVVSLIAEVRRLRLRADGAEGGK